MFQVRLGLEPATYGNTAYNSLRTDGEGGKQKLPNKFKIVETY
jgi:hypothetical protein